MNREHALVTQVVLPKLAEKGVSVSAYDLDDGFLNWMTDVAHSFLEERANTYALVAVSQCGRLFVGCYPSVCSLRALESIGITHVLNAASEVCASPFVDKLTYLDLPLDDLPTEDISRTFDQAVDFIHTALSSDENNRVAVHCQAGISRSVSLCIAYLISHENHTVDSALAQIRAVRSFAGPNRGFMRQLRDRYDTFNGLSGKEESDRVEIKF